MIGKKRKQHHRAPHRTAVIRLLRRTHFLDRRPVRAVYRGFSFVLRRRLVRGLVLGSAIILGLFTFGAVGLWWRLAAGPIEFDIVTPWLKAAIEQNFGGNHAVTVGGTQIERDEKGRTSLRLRDIVVRNGEGTVVASAPKAEVGISGSALLSGRLQAESLNLVGAEMAVRIEADGRVTVFAGADKRPIATAAPPVALPTPDKLAEPGSSQTPLRDGLQDLTGVFAWLDSVGAAGLDGHDLRELGLKDGKLVVDDKRSGKHWTFDHIDVSLARPKPGGITFHLESNNTSRPWVLNAAMRPLPDGIRAVGIEARKVSIRDIMLAMRLNDRRIDADLPISASLRADISADGTPQVVKGQLIAESGTIADREDETVRLGVDHADIRFDWDARRRSLIVPFRIEMGGNRFAMRATLTAPHLGDGEWLMTLTRGDPVIDPVILAPLGEADPESFALNRVDVRARIDTVGRRIEIEQGDFHRSDIRALRNVGVAVTGSLDWSGVQPNLAFGIAGTRMPLSVMKRFWPGFVAAPVRRWVERHISSGTVERIVIAANAPLPNFDERGPPMSEDGLSIDIDSSATTLRPLDDLPSIHDADLTIHVSGANATVGLGRGIVDVGSGRKLAIAGGIFEIPDTHQKPAPAHAAFRIDGSLPAAAELLSSQALRDSVGLALDPASSHGAVSAKVTLDFPIGKTVPKSAATYAVTADLTNFSADKILLNQRLEARILKVAASSKGYQIKGNVKINGMPAVLDVHRRKGDADAEFRLAANIDDAARRRLGLDLDDSVTGTIPVRVSGRFGAADNDDRLAIDADLTPVKIDNLFPGWVKPAGRAAHATYTLITTANNRRVDDLKVDGAGATVRGSVDIDNHGEIVSANFPVFSLSGRDNTALRAERGGDGVLRVSMRGDLYDGRSFIKSSLAGATDVEKGRKALSDLDLDIEIGTVAGFNGETLRGLNLKLSRRQGRIRNFAMNAKIGRDTPLTGDLRLRARDRHEVVYFETSDAGALLRFTDMYPRMFGGQMWIAVDPPAPEETPQTGAVHVRDFAVRGEPVLDRIVSGAPNRAGRKGSVDFSELRAEFVRTGGKMAVRDGVVRGPLVGVTIEGQIDHIRNDVHLRGTFVPLYGLNNIFGQIPILNMFLAGGRDEGLFGITYEAVGPPGAPRISVNPVTAIAPGLLRKFIPSPGSFDPQFLPPPR